MAAIPRNSVIAFHRATAIWLAIAVVLALAGWYKTINLLMLVGYVMIALALVNAVVGWILTRGLHVERLPSAAVYPGEMLSTSITITNPNRWPSTITLRDHADTQQCAWLVVQLQQHEARTLVARWTFAKRGVHPLGPLLSDCAYPFGIVHVQRTMALSGKALVLPALGRVDVELFRRWLARSMVGDSQERRSTRRAVPGDGDIRGLRPYRPGDSPRMVHWRSTARRGELLVHEYDSAQPIHLVLVVEPFLPDNPSQHQRDALEWALSLAMTMGQTWCDAAELSDLTLILAGEPTVTIRGPSYPGMARQRFTCLAEVSGTLRCKLDHEAMHAARGRHQVRLVISSRADSALVGELGVPALLVHPESPLPWYNRPGGSL